MTLSFGPGARAAARLQICQHAGFPLLEAGSMHVPAHGADLVIAEHADSILSSHGVPRARTFAGNAATSSFVRFTFSRASMSSRSHRDGALNTRDRECARPTNNRRRTKAKFQERSDSAAACLQRGPDLAAGVRGCAGVKCGGERPRGRGIAAGSVGRKWSRFGCKAHFHFREPQCSATLFFLYNPHLPPLLHTTYFCL